MIIKQRFPRLVLDLGFALAVFGLIWLGQAAIFDAAADGESYSVSLNSPISFPVDI